MKRVLSIAILGILSTGLFAQAAKKAQVNWISLEDAVKMNEKEPRKILVDVYTKWCGPCKMMMANTFTNPVIINYINENFYAVKFNAEGDKAVTFKGKTYKNPSYNPAARGRNGTHELTKAIAPVNGRIAYPTIVYMDEDLNILQPIQGYQKPADIEPILQYFGQDKHKTVPYPDFMKGFKSSFGTKP